MTEAEREYIALICIAAACADGHLGAPERERITRLSRDLGLGDRDLFRTALVRPVDVAAAGAHVTSQDGRRTAYQMAALVCRSDGVLTEPEGAFLGRLQEALGLSDAAARGMQIEASLYADPGLPPTAPPAREGGENATEQMILRYAMLAGAAELLPQGAATLVVLPLQLKLVYRIGQGHGVALDREQVMELVAAFGIGATSQVVESLARRVLGGVARQVGGRLFGGAASGATGALLAFSTTYAMGHAADTYYRRGRTLGEEDLRSLFARFQDDARTLYPKMETEVKSLADRMDATALMEKVRAIV